MRFLISVTLLGRPTAALRQRLDEALRAFEAVQLAPALWLATNEGDDPGGAETIADRLVSIVGAGDELQVIVAPMPYPGCGFGLSDEIARAIGAV